MRASRPSAAIRTGSPARSSPSTTTVAGRSTISFRPGMDRHPSSARSTASPISTMRGFTSANGAMFSSRGSTTITRCPTPTCGAARPTPSSAYIVSNMSAINARTSSVTRATGAAIARNTGSPITRTCRIAMRLFLHPAQHTGDFRSRHYDARVFRRFQRDAVIREMHDRPDDAAFRHHLVTLLQRGQHLLLLLLDPPLRPDQQEPRNQAERDNVDDDDEALLPPARRTLQQREKDGVQSRQMIAPPVRSC